MKITAYCSNKTWEHELVIRNSFFNDSVKVLDINSPIAYDLDDHFINLIRNTTKTDFCIDFAGRNYGVNESVYVSVGDIRVFLKEKGYL